MKDNRMISQSSGKKVFYEVVEQPALPTGVLLKYDYLSEDLRGLAYSYESMIDRVRSNEAFSGVDLELIQVESLASVTGYPSVNSSEDAITHGVAGAMPRFSVVQVFETHKKLGVPLSLTVGLVCKALKFNISQFVAEAGYGRNYMNKTLNGEHRPSKEFRELLVQRLGVDPWLYLPKPEMVVIQSQIVSAGTADY